MHPLCLPAGLDEAILGSAAAENPEDDGQRITALLQHGAHAVLGQDDAKAAEGDAFAAEVGAGCFGV